MTSTVHEDVSTFITISRYILHRMRNVWDKSCRENQNTHFNSSNFFFRKSCRLWYNVEKYGVDRGHKRRHNMAHTGCMLDKQGHTPADACKSPDTHTPSRTHTQTCKTYCFSTATTIRDSASMLRRTYTVCLVNWWIYKCRTADPSGRAI
jgi:hypothetical protein